MTSSLEDLARHIASNLVSKLPPSSPEERAPMKLVRFVCNHNGMLRNDQVVQMWMSEQELFSETCDYTSLVMGASKIITRLAPDIILEPGNDVDGTYLILTEIKSSRASEHDWRAVALRILQANEANIALEREELAIWLEHQRAEHEARKKHLRDLAREQDKLRQLLNDQGV